jgi:HSP20 family protein
MKYALRPQRQNNVFPSLFDDFITRNRFEGRNHKFAEKAALPAVNVKEDEKGFTLELLVPGRTKADFKIELKENILSISAEQKDLNEESVEYSVKEFSSKPFTRRFNLPEDKIDNEKIHASYEAGVLSLSLPKRPEEVKKEISRDIKIS